MVLYSFLPSLNCDRFCKGYRFFLLLRLVYYKVVKDFDHTFNNNITNNFGILPQRFIVHSHCTVHFYCNHYQLPSLIYCLVVIILQSGKYLIMCNTHAHASYKSVIVVYSQSVAHILLIYYFTLIQSYNTFAGRNVYIIFEP